MATTINQTVKTIKSTYEMASHPIVRFPAQQKIPLGASAAIGLSNKKVLLFSGRQRLWRHWLASGYF